MKESRGLGGMGISHTHHIMGQLTFLLNASRQFHRHLSHQHLERVNSLKRNHRADEGKKRTLRERDVLEL